MDLTSIFGKNKTEKRKSHIKNLISVAMADGHLAKEEWGLLMRMAKKLDMGNDEIHNIKNNPDDIKFVPPSKHEEKIQHIHDLVSLMTIDEHIDTKEMVLCRKIALKLDLLPRIVDDILREAYKNHEVVED